MTGIALPLPKTKADQRGALRKEVRLSFIRQRRVILLRSDIWTKVQVIFALRVLRANIIPLKLQVSISLCRKAKYHCETCLTISLIIFIFEMGIISKYVTHYGTFGLKVSIFMQKENWEKLLYEVSPKGLLLFLLYYEKRQSSDCLLYILIAARVCFRCGFSFGCGLCCIAKTRGLREDNICLSHINNVAWNNNFRSFAVRHCD